MHKVLHLLCKYSDVNKNAYVEWEAARFNRRQRNVHEKCSDLQDEQGLGEKSNSDPLYIFLFLLDITAYSLRKIVQIEPVLIQHDPSYWQIDTNKKSASRCLVFDLPRAIEQVFSYINPKEVRISMIIRSPFCIMSGIPVLPACSNRIE
ncbi:hypothetical protein Trydic_g2150 [Trypoxylus dichotomus]